MARLLRDPRAGIFLIIVLLMGTFCVSTDLKSEPQDVQEIPRKLVYVWYPRQADVPSDSSSPEVVILKTLLALSETRQYTVQAGDNLDYVIRHEFFVSSKLKNAYTLYVERIQELNSNINPSTSLKPNMILRLPLGPQFGATEFGKKNLPSAIAQNAFLNLSGKAYFGPANQYKARTDALTDKITRSVGYMVARNTAALSKMATADIASEVRSRGIVPAIDIDEHPETSLDQAQPILVTSDGSPHDNARFINLVSNEKQGRILPATIDKIQNIQEDCPQPCISCSNLLKLPSGVDVSKARVLVADTGIDPGALKVAANVIYTPAGQNGADISSDHHGTFVFSEIAASGHGIIPDSQIFIAKVASAGQGGEQFSISDIIKSWSTFTDTMAASKDIKATTWVANLSAEGQTAPNTQPPPGIPNDNRLLIVAAAGNGGSQLAPSNDVLPRLSNQNANLIIVGALSTTGNKASYSNYHPSNVQMFAQGDCVCGTPGQLNGTSQATPIVTTAAAILASARPQWYAREVMWRLLSTSDRPSNLRNMSVSGPVNLSRALTLAIIVRADGGPGQNINEFSGTQVQFDTEWTNAIKSSSSGIDSSYYLLLRLFDKNNIGGMVCFSPMRFLLPSTTLVCVSPGARVTLTVGSVPKSFSASEIEDIILPMDTDRADALPTITVKLQ